LGQCGEDCGCQTEITRPAHLVSFYLERIRACSRRSKHSSFHSCLNASSAGDHSAFFLRFVSWPIDYSHIHSVHRLLIFFRTHFPTRSSRRVASLDFAFRHFAPIHLLSFISPLHRSFVSFVVDKSRFPSAPTRMKMPMIKSTLRNRTTKFMMNSGF